MTRTEPSTRTRRSGGAGPGAGTRRRAAPFLAAAALLAAAGCASDAPARPEGPAGSGLDRSEVVPSGVTEMRESLSAQRSETLDSMDTARPEATDTPTGGPGMLETFLDAVGWATGRAVDVLSLQAFGLW